MDVENLKTFDPFADTATGGTTTNAPVEEVHIRIQQRSGRKTLTTVAGLADDLDLKKILRCWKKEFCVNGAVLDTADSGKVLQLQGDNRERVAKFLVEEQIIGKESVKIHGF